MIVEDFLVKEELFDEKLEDKDPLAKRIVWKNIIIFSSLHIGSIIGIYLAIFYAKWQTIGLGKLR